MRTRTPRPSRDEEDSSQLDLLFSGFTNALWGKKVAEAIDRTIFGDFMKKDYEFLGTYFEAPCPELTMHARLAVMRKNFKKLGFDHFSIIYQSDGAYLIARPINIASKTRFRNVLKKAEVSFKAVNRMRQGIAAGHCVRLLDDTRLPVGVYHL